MKLITGQLKPSKGEHHACSASRSGRIPALYFRIGFCPEQDAFYERMTGLEWVTALVRLNGVGEPRPRRGGAARARGGRSARRGRQEDRRLQQGHAAAGEDGAGDRARSRAADPRRAAVRHGSDRAPQDDPHDQGLGPRRQEHHRLEPHPARDRVDDLEHPPDQPGTDPRRRQRAPDPRSHRRASAHRATSRRSRPARSRASSSRTTMCSA